MHPFPHRYAVTATPQDTYLGPVIVNTRATAGAPNPTSITWINDLGNTAATGVLAYKYSTDQTLHWADPLNAEANMCGHMAVYPAYLDPCSLNYGEVVDPDPANPRIFTNAPIPAVPHLHGGEVPAEIDGGPDSWFTSNGAYKGHEISKEVNDALDAHTKAFYSLDNVDSSLRNDWETYRQQFLTISKGIRIH